MSDKGQQRHVTRLLNRLGQKSLMVCGDSCDTSRQDLTAIGDELDQRIDIFVIDLLGFDACGCEGTALAALRSVHVGPLGSWFQHTDSLLFR